VNTVTIFLKVYPKTRGEFMQTVGSLREQMRNTQGLRKSVLYQDVDDANTFKLVEEWMTQDDLNNRLQSEQFQVLIGALKVLSEQAEIRYQLDSRQWGTHAEFTGKWL
jgi:quinol monooxygenase YgiN